MNELDFSCWSECELELKAKDKLIKDHGQSGNEKYSLYSAARKLALTLLEYIKFSESYLTDHGPKHIRNVMENAFQLLGPNIEAMSGAELYCLLLSILMHDIGNLHGRLEHEKKVGEAYEHVFSSNCFGMDQRGIVNRIVDSHCGVAHDGTDDKLKFLRESNIFQPPVKVDLCKIASILRFADELAEGPQRTSQFMTSHFKFPKDAEIHHKYSEISKVFIDRDAKNARIALSYHIYMKVDENGIIENKKDVKELLEYIYKRIIKLNAERIFTKHYCEYLSPFKETTAAFFFYINKEVVELGLPNITLTDLILPSQVKQNIEKHNSDYQINNIFKIIQKRYRPKSHRKQVRNAKKRNK